MATFHHRNIFSPSTICKNTHTHTHSGLCCLLTHRSCLHRCRRRSRSSCRTSRCEERTHRPHTETQTIYTPARSAETDHTTPETRPSRPCSLPVRHTAGWWTDTCPTARRRRPSNCGRPSRRWPRRSRLCHRSGKAGRCTVRCGRRTHPPHTTADLRCDKHWNWHLSRKHAKHLQLMRLCPQ